MSDIKINPSTGAEVLFNVYDDNGSLEAVNTSAQVLFAVYEPDGTGKGRLRINLSGGTGGAEYLDDLTDVDVSGVTNGQLLGYNGVGWVAVSPSATGAFPLSDLTDTTITSIGVNQIIKWDGTAWINVDISDILDNYYTSGETNVNFLSADTSFYTESEIDNFFTGYYTSSQTNANYLSADTSFYTQTEADNNFLSASTTISDLDGYTKTETNNSFLSATTTIHDLNGLTETEIINNFLSADTVLVANLTDLGDVVISTPSNDASLVYNSSTGKWNNKILTYTINGLTDTNISSMSDGEVLVWDSATSTWINAAQTDTKTLVGLTDTDINTPTLNQVLQYNDSSGKWENNTLSLTTTLESLTDTTITSPAANQWLNYNGSSWVNTKIQLENLENVTIGALTSGEILTWNGSIWVNSANTSTSVSSLNDIGDVSVAGVSVDEIIVWDGSSWINSANTASGGVSETWVTNNFLSANTSLSGLSDVSLSSVTTNDALIYDGTNWVNSASTSTSTTVSNGLTKFGDEIKLGGTLTATTTIGDLVAGNIQNFNVYGKYDGTLDYDNEYRLEFDYDINYIYANLYVRDGHFGKFSGLKARVTHGNYTAISNFGGANMYIQHSVANLTESLKIYGTQIDYSADYSASYNDRSLVDKAYVYNNFLSASTTTSLSGLTDVTLSSVTSGQSLIYDGSEWVNSAVTDVTMGLNDLSDVTLSAVTDNQILLYNSTSSEWENNDSMIVDILNPISGDTIVYTSAGTWVNSAATVDMSNYYTSTECDNNFLSASTTFLSDNIYTTDSGLTSDRALSLSAHTLTISGVSAQTIFDDDSISTVITSDGSSVTGTTDISTWSVGVQDTETYDLSYIDINLNSGITISSNNSGSTSSGDTSYMTITSSGFDTTMIIDELNNVSISGEVSGDSLTYNGTNWVNSAISYYTESEVDANFLSANTSLSGLSDVSITSVGTGQTLYYSGTEWVNSALTYSASEFNIGDGSSESKIILTSSGGTSYYLVVDDLGNLTTTAV